MTRCVTIHIKFPLQLFLNLILSFIANDYWMLIGPYVPCRTLVLKPFPFLFPVTQFNFHLSNYLSLYRFFLLKSSVSDETWRTLLKIRRCCGFPFACDQFHYHMVINWITAVSRVPKRLWIRNYRSLSPHAKSACAGRDLLTSKRESKERIFRRTTSYWQGWGGRIHNSCWHVSFYANMRT